MQCEPKEDAKEDLDDDEDDGHTKVIEGNKRLAKRPKIFVCNQHNCFSEPAWGTKIVDGVVKRVRRKSCSRCLKKQLKLLRNKGEEKNMVQMISCAWYTDKKKAKQGKHQRIEIRKGEPGYIDMEWFWELRAIHNDKCERCGVKVHYKTFPKGDIRCNTKASLQRKNYGINDNRGHIKEITTLFCAGCQGYK